jgi:hypothetical protein
MGEEVCMNERGDIDMLHLEKGHIVKGRMNH